jgi:hypothetical protein
MTVRDAGVVCDGCGQQVGGGVDSALIVLDLDDAHPGATTTLHLCRTTADGKPGCAAKARKALTRIVKADA